MIVSIIVIHVSIIVCVYTCVSYVVCTLAYIEYIGVVSVYNCV
jgi:hypothetical protein